MQVQNQSLLLQHLKTIFPFEEIVTNSKQATNIKYAGTGAYLELDIWVPSLNISFEFQDNYHYITTWYTHKTLNGIQQNDSIKKAQLQMNGINLVVVPCWWDGSIESLQASIIFQRPDLVTIENHTNYFPVSLNPSYHFFPNVELPHVGELMQASFPLDPKFYDKISPSKFWWLGEKYDGIRCCWNPVMKTVFTRNGRELKLPSELITNFPNQFLDAEFWFGRQLYVNTFPLFKGFTDSVQWSSLRVISFDVPDYEFNQVPFEIRYKLLLENISSDNSICIIPSRIRCDTKKRLNLLNKTILDEDGEGIILRKAGSFYEHGKSQSLIKLKLANVDTEGLIVSVEDDSVQVKLPSGVIFAVPANEVKVKQGDIVTFIFENFSRRDIPVKPEIVRVRTDLNWNDLILNQVKELEFRKANQQEKENYTTKAHGHWTIEKMREYMLNFVKKQNLDPLVPDSWYSITSKSIYLSKGGETILRKLNGFSNMLKKLFSDLNFDETKLPVQDLRPIDKQRIFFENYAKENGFDALIPDNWYSVSSRTFATTKGASAVLFQHSGLANALLSVFPDIGLVRTKFRRQMWETPEKRRQFFIKYAETKGFDPLQADNWYAIPRARKSFPKELCSILFHHRNSVTLALVDLFPDIGLQKHKFLSQTIWTLENQRNFLEEYAKENGFNPLIPSNWYNHPRKKMKLTKKMSKILFYHGNSIARTLLDVFPDIGLDKEKLYLRKSKIQ